MLKSTLGPAGLRRLMGQEASDMDRVATKGARRLELIPKDLRTSLAPVACFGQGEAHQSTAHGAWLRFHDLAKHLDFLIAIRRLDHFPVNGLIAIRQWQGQGSLTGH